MTFSACAAGCVPRPEVVGVADAMIEARWMLSKPRHNYRYVCAELIRLYYRGQELLSDV
jgi:hypothetical protein